jgi:hypothetical protein
MPLPETIQRNYIESFQFLEARKKRQVNQLVLLNNLQRGDQNIASTLLLTLFNRVLSSSYDDKLQVKFLPSQGINQDQLNAYNILAQSDYQEMGKAKLDYDWIWDTLFFGRGYCETLQFDKKRKIMVPHAINPLVFGYDPYFENPQEWRYYWKWITKDKYTLQRLIKSGKITGVKSVEEIPSGVEPNLWEYKQRRDAASKAVEPSLEPAQADVYQILEYFGYNDQGDRCAFWVDKHFSKILMEEELELEDLELEDGKMGSKWPIVVKESFRLPHASVPFSIADLLEDKHRAKSVLLNLAYIAAKDHANPLYWYDPDKVRDVSQFFSRQVNQHIPVEGDGALAVGPLNTKDPMDAGLINFMTALQQEANDPVGTGVSMEPAQGGQQTATEVAIDQQMNDMAQSLQSKVLQFGEAEFWSHWFHRYAKYGPELKEKMANIVGVKGIESSIVDFKDFNTSNPPGVLVFSAKEAEYKNLVKRRDFMQILPDLQASMDPEGFRNFQKHVFMPLMLEDPSLIDIMYPDTLDEIHANEENELLKEEKMPEIKDTDNHTTHIYTHMMVKPDTWAKWFHIEAHKEALAKQQAQAMLQEQAVAQGASAPASPPGAKPPMGVQKSSPQAAASPLKDQVKTPLNI